MDEKTTSGNSGKTSGNSGKTSETQGKLVGIIPLRSHFGHSHRSTEFRNKPNLMFVLKLLVMGFILTRWFAPRYTIWIEISCFLNYSWPLSIDVRVQSDCYGLVLVIPLGFPEFPVVSLGFPKVFFIRLHSVTIPLTTYCISLSSLPRTPRTVCLLFHSF